MFELCNARPCGERALFLQTSSERSLLKSLKHLFNAVQDVIPNLSQDIQTRIKILKKTHRIPGIYYLLNSFLLKFIESENYEEIEHISKEFTGLNYTHDGLDIIKYKEHQFADYIWNLFDKVSLYHLPEGSYNFVPTQHNYQVAQQKINDSLHILTEHCGDLWEEFNHLVKEIIILDSNRVIAGSSFDLLGLIYIRSNPQLETIDYLDMLVHEEAHQYIFNISALDPLCLNDPNEKYQSPLRKDPRPLLGIFHATFVIARLIYLFKTLEQKKLNIGCPLTKIKEKISLYQEKYQSGFESTMQHGKLTSLGRDLILSTHELVM